MEVNYSSLWYTRSPIHPPEAQEFNGTIWPTWWTVLRQVQLLELCLTPASDPGSGLPRDPDHCLGVWAPFVVVGARQLMPPTPMQAEPNKYSSINHFKAQPNKILIPEKWLWGRGYFVDLQQFPVEKGQRSWSECRVFVLDEMVLGSCHLGWRRFLR